MLELTTGFVRFQLLQAHYRRMKTLRTFFASESGAAAIEYALLAAGIALVIVGDVQGIEPSSTPSHVDQ